MRVEMLKTIVGGPDPANGLGEFCFREGQIVDLKSDKLALAWLNSDPPKARAVKEERETATVGASETAAKGTRKRQAIGR